MIRTWAPMNAASIASKREPAVTAKAAREAKRVVGIGNASPVEVVTTVRRPSARRSVALDAAASVVGAPVIG